MAQHENRRRRVGQDVPKLPVIKNNPPHSSRLGTVRSATTVSHSPHRYRGSFTYVIQRQQLSANDDRLLHALGRGDTVIQFYGRSVCLSLPIVMGEPVWSPCQRRKRPRHAIRISHVHVLNATVRHTATSSDSLSPADHRSHRTIKASLRATLVKDSDWE